MASAALSYIFGDGYPSGITADEREAVRRALQRHNLKMALFLMPAAVLAVLGLLMVDVERYQQGLLHSSTLHQALALSHGVFAIATLMGLRYYLPRWQTVSDGGIRGFTLFLVLLLGSIDAMSLLGIIDRGSTTLMSIALMLFNLVFRLPLRVVVVLNLILLPVACGLRLFYGVDFSSMLIGMLELLGLSAVTLVTGYGLSRQTVANVLGEFREARRHQALVGELEIAARMQRSLLPRRWPNSAAFSLFGVMEPAKNVGGDYFDYLTLNDGRQVLIIADVCDKGVAAGLFGMMCKSVSRSALLRNASIEDAFASINAELCEDNEDCMFASCIGASYDPLTGSVHLVNAGHVPPVLIRASGDLEWIQAPRAPALGMRAGRVFGAVEFQLAPGDTLLLMTDGVTEAMNAAGEQFGAARVEAALRGLHVETPQVCIQRLTDAVAFFVSKVEQSDDVTCLALVHKGAPA